MKKKITFDPELMGHIKTIYGDASLDEKTLKQLHQTWKSNPDIIRNTAKQKKSTAPLKGVSFNVPGTSSKPSKLQMVSEIAQDDLRGVKSFNTAFKEARNRGLKQFQWGKGTYTTQIADNPTKSKGKPANEIPEVVITAPRIPRSYKHYGKKFESNDEPATLRSYSYYRNSIDPMIPAEPLKPFPPIAPSAGAPTLSVEQLPITGRISSQGPYRTIGPSSRRFNQGNDFMMITDENLTVSPGDNPVYEKIGNYAEYPYVQQFMWGTNKFKQGGKLDEKQKAFVAYLIEISGAKSESELNQYIQELGEEGLQEQRKQFEQLMTQGTEQIQTAAKGAKLNYIKALRGQCPEGFEMNYFKKGGVICSKCIKKAQAQQATPKAEKGTKVVRDFKAEMDKCGGKMKKKSTKKQTGGPIIEKDQGGNKMLSEKDWKKKVDSEAKADSAAYAKAYPNSEIAKKFNKDNPSKKKPIKKPAKKQGGGVISDFQRSLMNKQIAKKGLVGASTIFQKIANKGGKHAQAFSNMKQEIDNQVMSNSPLGKPVFSANNQAAPTPKVGYRVPNQSPISWQSRQVQQNGITFNQSSPVSYEIGTAYR